MSQPLLAENVTISDFARRLTNRPILATTAMYGPWTSQGRFDFACYESLVRDVLESGSVPATNVDTTWAQYNSWELATRIIARKYCGLLGRSGPYQPGNLIVELK